MTPVYQTIIDSKRGNCFTAALATILELELAEVPNFAADADGGDDWMDDARHWLADRGLALIVTVNERMIPVRPGALCIALGKSQHGDWNHVVVGFLIGDEFQMGFDPNPAGNGLDGDPTHYMFLVPLDPSVFSESIRGINGV